MYNLLQSHKNCNFFQKKITLACFKTLSFSQLAYSLFAANKGTNPETAGSTAIENMCSIYITSQNLFDVWHGDFAFPPRTPFFLNAKNLRLQIYPAQYLNSFQTHKFTVFCNTFRLKKIREKTSFSLKIWFTFRKLY